MKHPIYRHSILQPIQIIGVWTLGLYCAPTVKQSWSVSLGSLAIDLRMVSAQDFMQLRQGRFPSRSNIVRYPTDLNRR